MVFSYARSEEKLKKLARDAAGNARAGTPDETVQEADALLLAVHWSRMNDVLNQTGDLSGKVILTCSLPRMMTTPNSWWRTPRRARKKLRMRLPNARVVSAFNTVPSEVLFGSVSSDFR